MRTYRFINRHGREVDVAQEGAVLIFNNPSMRFVGEVITNTEIIDVKKKRLVIIEKFKYKEDDDGKRKRVPFEVEEEEEYDSKEMVTTYEVDPDSTPISLTDDVSKTESGTIRQKTLVDSAGKQTKRSTINKQYK